LLLDSLTLRNKAGKPFLVFTPFWKHSQSLPVDLPETTQGTPLHSKIQPQQSITLSQLQLLPQIPWADGFTQAWKPSRQGALKHLDQAVNKSEHYLSQRDLPASDGTSQLSPYLHFGQISPREFHNHIHRHAHDPQKADTGILRQLYWREFSAHLLYHFPHSQNHALKKEYDLFPWEFDMTQLQAWQRGQTGFPIVDAGMRQLWHTGWMHNRVRMITASFLVKHLLQPWQEGARWFWETLVDADLANNSMGWQWVAGSVADASNYFSIMLNRDYASGGTIATPINVHEGSGNLADVTAYQGDPTLSGIPKEIDRWYIKADGDMNTFNKEGAVIIGPGRSIGLSFTGDHTSGILYSRLSFLMEEVL